MPLNAHMSIVKQFLTWLIEEIVQENLVNTPKKLTIFETVKE